MLRVACCFLLASAFEVKNDPSRVMYISNEKLAQETSREPISCQREIRTDANGVKFSACWTQSPDSDSYDIHYGHIVFAVCLPIIGIGWHVPPVKRMLNARRKKREGIARKEREERDRQDA